MEILEQHIQVLDDAADILRIELECLLQFAEHADEVQDQPDRLSDALHVHIGPVHARNRLQQHMVAHGLVEVHAIETRRVIAGQELVCDDQNLRLHGRLLEVVAAGLLLILGKLEPGHEGPVHNVRGAFRINGSRPLGRQVFVEFDFVLGAGFSVHRHDEGLVAEGEHVLLEVSGDECSHLLDPIVSRQERP